ncbi:MAG: outer membrane beta-barrel protein [Pseudomonadota bacterium]
MLRSILWIVLASAGAAATAQPAPVSEWAASVELLGARSELGRTADRGQYGTGETIGTRIDGAFDAPAEADTSAAVGLSVERRLLRWHLGLATYWMFPVDWDIEVPLPSQQTVFNTFTNVERRMLLVRIGRHGQLRPNLSWHVTASVGPVELRYDTEYIDRAVPGLRRERREQREDSDTDLAWGLEFGLKHRLAERWTAGVSYRFLRSGDLEVAATASDTGRLTTELDDHQLALSLSYRFRR